MAGSVRNKIRYGTLFLFALLVLLGGISIYFLLKLKNDSRQVLAANYESIGYCNEMQQQLDSFSISRSMPFTTFNRLLQQQEANITEVGEQQQTKTVRQSFTAFRNKDTSKAIVFAMQQHLQAIINLNLQAIQRKSLQAESSAENATTLITIISSIAILIALSFAFNFPDIVIKPVNKLMKAIGEISQKNYKYRVHLEDAKNEFGQLATSFNEMAERLEYFENSNLNKIIFEKTRAEAVINSLRDASIGIDKNDTVLFANNQALQLLGLPTKDMVGMQTDAISKRNDLFRFLLEEKGSTPFKIVVDNRENYFTKEVVEVQQGDTSNRVIVLKNITSFKELDVAKTNFIATVSHELKTPLASSDFGIKLLEDDRVGKLTDEQKDLVAHLKKDNQRMLKILSELLNMAQVETGKIQMNLIDCVPEDLSNMAIEGVASSALAKGVRIQKKYAAGFGKVKADSEKTVWVISNLLTNALRYVAEGGTVVATIQNKDSFVHFSVTDNGKGIPPEYISKVFDRFFKVPGSAGGTGIGLSICKEIIEAENGQLWLESSGPSGSIFTFKLPVA